MQSITPSQPYPPLPADFNLAAHVLALAALQPRAVALEVWGDQGTAPISVLTYGALVQAVQGLATGLMTPDIVGARLQRGDRVLMRLGNSAEFPVLFLACICAGLVPVPTSAQLMGHEVATLCDLVDPALIVAAKDVAMPSPVPCPVLSANHLAALHALPPHPFDLGDANRLAYIIFTSGTSGRPQAVAHAHRAILARQMMMQGWYGLRHSDRVLHAGAFNWTYTLGTGLMDPWTMGATAVIPAPGTPASGLPYLIAQAQATIFAAAPGVYRQALRADFLHMPHLRHGLSAGETLPTQTRSAWETATRTPIFEAFGMSEISTFISASPDRPAPTGSTGYAQPGRQIAVLDGNDEPTLRNTPGVLAVHATDPGLFLGYFRDPAATNARMRGDWYVTGDIVTMADDGAITYLGRDDDMMNAGGFRVSPTEVEAAMTRCLGLTDCAVIEVQVGQGASIIACVYTSAQPLDDAALAAHADASLARYKQPRAFHHLPSLPRNANGKLNRKALRAAFTPSPLTP
jgi:acyl-coenzyme A synthetase/AMP-(fatty) acid ligase